MLRVSVFAVVILSLSAGLCQGANTVEELSRENTELKQRVGNLEKELEAIKKMVAGIAGQTAQPTPQVPAGKLSDEQLAKIADMVAKERAEGKKPILSNLDVELYGFFKFDAAFDTGRTNAGNYAKWVENDSSNSNDDQLNMTANQTRFGLNFKGPQDDNLKTSGKVEIDFYGGEAENKSHIMMRHAYMKFDWPNEKTSLLAGQTWDVMSPLNPGTLNYSVMWWSGNIGYRRPQIRLTKAFDLSNGSELKFEGALARAIGLSGGSTTDFTPGDAGEDAGIPILQGRVSSTVDLFENKPATVGLSGHWGREEYDTNAGGGNDKFDTWSLNLDLTQPINDRLTIKGELFTGENLSAYLGGIGQGVRNTGTAATPNYTNEIASKGGWVAASIGPCDKWNFNIGAGIDDPDDGDMGSGSRTLNRSIFGNAIYSLNKNAKIGFELSHWHTEYKSSGNADSIRAQTSFIYKF
jgi:hypothetical protein